MAIIEAIKQKILQLDSGTFQNLCDVYLYKKGYSTIVSLGSEAGTRKTTKGTPDTYFSTMTGQYVFVEYTTQKRNLFSKIQEDIEKCLDVSNTGITHNKIAEIIYCHTSSNITPLQNESLKALCEKHGIMLTIIGIDQLAEDLYLYHHVIARDFLQITMSTGQIQTSDDFVKEYNGNRMAAPIDTPFLFRDKEIGIIDEAFRKVDIVILAGAAGTGKTRLALHFAKSHSNKHNEKFYCIHSKALPIYEDLQLFFNNPASYFILVDDANHLSGLQHIIRYTTMQPEGYQVKILVTVRDYALQKVANDMREIVSYETITIRAFTDNEIKELLATTLGIINEEYQDRIARIAEGNVRIAMLAGKVASISNRLDSIDDVSQLYEDYYGSSLEENQLLSDKTMCIAAGVIAFLEAIHLDYIDFILPIIEEKGMTRESFIENLNKLHEREIVDIYNDKAVRFSEQGMSNYLLKYVFFDKKFLSLSTMIRVCFQGQQERTITSVNTLLNIFRNEDLLRFVEKELKALWNELSQEKSLWFYDFMKVFFRVNPTETLLILKNQIDHEETVLLEASDIDTEKGKNYQSVTNGIIEILGGFANMADLSTALDLFFLYYSKRSDLYMQFFHSINQSFGIKKEAIRYGFYTQIAFFTKIKEHSNEWQEESVVILFLEVSKEFLKLHFSPAEGRRKNTVVIYQIPLSISEGVEKYRTLIWEALTVLCSKDKYKRKIIGILDDYGKTIDEISASVLQFDLPYIKAIMEIAFPPSDLRNCLLADSLVQIFAHENIPKDSFFNRYFGGEKFCLYQLLEGGTNQKGIAYPDRKKTKRPKIEEHISICSIEMLKQLIDVCHDTIMLDSHTAWNVRDGLAIAFDAVFRKQDYYVDAIRYYLETNTPHDLHPDVLVSRLFSLLPDSDVFSLINDYEYGQKNAWIYAYYHEVPLELISIEHLQGLYDFLTDTSDKAITSSSYRDVDFLEKYSIVDKDALIKGCEIILSKFEYSPFVAHLYFELLFNDLHNPPCMVLQKFSGNLELLEKIYCAMLAYDHHHDHDGKFIMEIYLVKPSILDKYIDWLVNKDDGTVRDDGRYQCFFLTDDFMEVFDKLFESVIQGCKFFVINGPSFLESFLLPDSNKPDLLEKQDMWIRHCIMAFSNSEIKMRCLFSTIAKLDNSRKKEYLWLFLDNNSSFEAFEQIPLTPTSWTTWGSAIPMYSLWVEFFESLLPDFVGFEWIKHKKHIETKIDSLKEEIESEEIKKILHG